MAESRRQNKNVFMKQEKGGNIQGKVAFVQVEQVNLGLVSKKPTIYVA